MIDRIESEVEMLDRHLRILRTVAAEEPIGIVRLSNELSIPDHKVRYSLEVLEEEELIEPTQRGATTTGRFEEWADGANERIETLRDRVAAAKIGDDSTEVVDRSDHDDGSGLDDDGSGRDGDSDDEDDGDETRIYRE